MDRRARRRVSALEQAISAAKKKREEQQKKLIKTHMFHARLHATAVGAIILSGAPKLDEPLSAAWTRVLQHYKIRPQVQLMTRLDPQVSAAQELFPVIVGSGNESTKFTELFGAAPGWLMWFTGVILFDASLLKFDLPNSVGVPKKWGRSGYEESRHWPLLPLGRMTDGDPVPFAQSRYWPFPLDMTETDSTPSGQDDPVQDDEADENDLDVEILRSMNFLFDLEADPEKEKELTRYERRRLRKLYTWIDSLRDD